MLCDKCRHAEKCPAKAEYGGAKRCSAYKPQEMTNEEYLKSCNTEELAILLCNELFVVEKPKPSLACRYRNELFKCFPLNPMDAYYEVMKWLQEKHDAG